VQTSRTVAWSTWKCGHIGAWSPTRHTPTRGVYVIAVTTSSTNVHDKHMCGTTLDAVVLKGSRGPRRPKNLCLDKGYDDKQPDLGAREK